MANIKPSFSVTENASGLGIPLSAKQEGDTATAGNYAGMLICKDGSDNLQFLNQDASGNLLVSVQDATACLDADGTSVGSLSEVALATITLTVDKVYSALELQVSSLQFSHFRVVWNDNASETDLISGVFCGAGNYNFDMTQLCKKFTAGSIGTQELIVYGTNLYFVSNMYGSATIREAI
jgi:hypothetical protein